jgi:hypothetical protein
LDELAECLVQLEECYTVVRLVDAVRGIEHITRRDEARVSQLITEEA